MPGPAPAKVQHLVHMIEAKTGSEVVPVWNLDQNEWTILYEQESVCKADIHTLLAIETGDCYNGCGEHEKCTAGHTIQLAIRFWQVGKKSARRWKSKGTVGIDSKISTELDVGKIMSLLSKPTNPQGDGKATGTAAGSNKQNMSVKRSTVIRV